MITTTLNTYALCRFPRTPKNSLGSLFLPSLLQPSTGTSRYCSLTGGEGRIRTHAPAQHRPLCFQGRPLHPTWVLPHKIENQYCVRHYTIRIERFLSVVLKHRAPSPEDFPSRTVPQYCFGRGGGIRTHSAQRQRIYSPPRLSNFGAPRYKSISMAFSS